MIWDQLTCVQFPVSSCIAPAPRVRFRDNHWVWRCYTPIRIWTSVSRPKYAVDIISEYRQCNRDEIIYLNASVCISGLSTGGNTSVDGHVAVVGEHLNGKITCLVAINVASLRRYRQFIWHTPTTSCSQRDCSATNSFLLSYSGFKIAQMYNNCS